MNPNETRNKELIEKRLEDPRYWSFARLGKHYGITKQTAQGIFKRDLAIYATTKEILDYQKAMERRLDIINRPIVAFYSTKSTV